MKMSFQQYLAHEARVKSKHQPTPVEAVSRESDLHDQIISHCKAKGWYYVHSRMDRATTTACGVPDFIIAGPGETFWIECKAKGNKPSLAQQSTIVHLTSFGHRAAIVWSFEEFLNIVNPKT